MKTIQLNRFMGKISIPQNMSLVKSGVTKKGDQVTQDADFRLKSFVRVAVGGLNVGNYMAVMRRIKNPIAKKPAKKVKKSRKMILAKRSCCKR